MTLKRILNRDLRNTTPVPNLMNNVTNNKNYENTRISVRSITALAEFQEIKNEWNGVVSASDFPSVHLSHDWVSAWWQNYGQGGGVFCFLLSDSEGCFGVAVFSGINFPLGPLRISALRLMGNELSSRSDILLLRQPEAGMKAIVAQLASRPWLFLDFGRCTSASPALASIRANSAMFSVQLREQFDVPLVDLSLSWEAWLANKSRNFRKSIRRAKEKCKDYGVYRYPQEGKDVERLIDAVERVAADSWSFAEGSSIVSKSSEREFICQIMSTASQRNDLIAALLYDSDKPIAFAFGIRQGDVMFGFKTGYRSAYSEQGVGMTVMAVFIECCMADNRCKILDMDCISSNGEYKRRWADKFSQSVSYRIFRRRPLSSLLALFYKMKKKYHK